MEILFFVDMFQLQIREGPGVAPGQDDLRQYVVLHENWSILALTHSIYWAKVWCHKWSDCQIHVVDHVFETVQMKIFWDSWLAIFLASSERSLQRHSGCNERVFQDVSSRCYIITNTQPLCKFFLQFHIHYSLNQKQYCHLKVFETL